MTPLHGGPRGERRDSFLARGLDNDNNDVKNKDKNLSPTRPKGCSKLAQTPIKVNKRERREGPVMFMMIIIIIVIDNHDDFIIAMIVMFFMIMMILS